MGHGDMHLIKAANRGQIQQGLGRVKVPYICTCWKKTLIVQTLKEYKNDFVVFELPFLDE